MFNPIALGLAAALALTSASVSVSYSQVSTAPGAANGGGSAAKGATNTPGGAALGTAAPNPNSRQPVPGTNATNPSPITRNHNDCNKSDCVDNSGGG